MLYLQKNRMKKCIISGIIGGAIIVLAIIVVSAFVNPINYAPIYLLNPEKAVSYADSVYIDSIRCLHIEVLKDLESKGVLLNPSEYTSHIADYYKVGSINSIFYFLHKAAEPFNCLEQDNLA